MAKKFMANRVKFQYNEHNKNAFHMLDVVPGKEIIKLPRTTLDVETAHKGAVVKCMNANCAARNKVLMPFDYHFAFFHKTRAFFVTKLSKSGQPVECVGYKHNNSRDIEVHDKMGPKAILDKGLADKVITLSPLLPPRKRKPSDDVARPNRPTTIRRPSRAVARGAAARAIDAGLFVPELHEKTLKKAA